MPKIAYRRHRRSFWLESTPTKVSEMSRSGNSNAAPNARISRVTKPRYLPMVSTATTRWVPAKPRRNARPLGRVSMAKNPPSANRDTELRTKGMEYRRSLWVRPGVMYSHSSNRITGRAMAKPSAPTSLILTRNGSTTLRYTSAHGFFGFWASCVWCCMKLQNGFDKILKTGRYSGHATAMPITIDRIEMISRVLSSVRCSMTVMVPSGFCRRRLKFTAIGSPFRTRHEATTGSAFWMG